MLNLSFYQNVSGVHVGALRMGEQRLLDTTHPATIAAAIFAMDEYNLEVSTSRGSHLMQFPAEDADLFPLTTICVDAAMIQFMTGLVIFSRTNFSAPPGFDKQAEIHFRTAVHHLPEALVKNPPKGPAPKSFMKELRERNKYIYYPCV